MLAEPRPHQTSRVVGEGDARLPADSIFHQLANLLQLKAAKLNLDPDLSRITCAVGFYK